MTGQDHPGDTAAELRARAEAAYRQRTGWTPEELTSIPPDEARRTLHELLVHQIELEIQNEELRRAHAELDAVRARYFDLYDLAPVSYVTVSETGLILEANLTAAARLGVPRSDLVRQPLSRFIFKGDQDTYYVRRQALVDTGEPQAYELRMVTPDGGTFWVWLSTTTAQTADGAPVCRITMSDITERKRAEAALRESEERLKLALKGSRQGFWDWNLETGEIKRDDGWAGMLGFTLEEINSMDDPWNTLLHPADAAMAIDTIRQHVNGDTPHYRIEYRMKHQNGNYRWILDQAQVVKYNLDGKPVRMTGTHTDITELKETEKKLRDKADELEKFNRLMLGRELKMIELKKEVNTLLKKAGEDEKYSIPG